LNKNLDLKSYGFNHKFQHQITTDEITAGLVPARVITVQKETYKIAAAHGEKYGKLKGSIFYQDTKYKVYPAVGDFVLVKPNETGDDIIYRVLERGSSFSRLNPTLRDTITRASEQIVAANFDYVFLMASLNYDFNVRRMERYLAAAWQSGGTPVIILTKADLCENYKDIITELEHIALGVDIVVISAHTGFGMEHLQKYMQPGTTLVFLGSSGIGKSSLVNALAGEELMKVNTIRENDSKGQHTTTYRQLFVLNSGVVIIDTPGMRELGMWDVEEGIETVFSDIEELFHNCRFRNCSHSGELGCAVQEAIDCGNLTKERWKSYQKLIKEANYSANKAAYLRSQKALYKNEYKKFISNKH
jgi:ribosome biogenesis GTPase